MCKGEGECCPDSGAYGGEDGEEQKAVQDWFDKVKGDWLDKDFKNNKFELWDEFDIRKSKDLLDKLNGMDPATTSCDASFQKLRWDLGYNVFNPDLYDWDDKIAKKGIVAGMMPKDEKDPWYLPLIYAAYSPSWTHDDQVDKLESALKKYFDANPNGLLFLKLAVSGSTGTGIPKCEEGITRKSNMYMVFPGYTRKALVQCLGLMRAISEEPLPDYRNPALQNGYPGFLVEPGFPHMTEVKTLVIWGRLFAIGAEKPNCCAFYSNNGITFRGFDGDDRKAPDGRSYSDWMKELDGKPNAALLDKDLLDQVKKIAEGVGKHADYIRVDMFVNTDTRKVVVNEIESFFSCGSFALKTDNKIEKFMSQIWLQGWKDYQAQNALTNTLRPFSQEQMAVATSQGRNGKPNIPKSVCPDCTSPFYNIMIYLIWPLIAAGCFGIGWYVKSQSSPSARNVAGTELSTTLA
jgi:hypothetical protein